MKMSIEDADHVAADEKSMGGQMTSHQAWLKTLQKSDKRTTAFAPLLDPEAQVRHSSYLRISTVMMSHQGLHGYDYSSRAPISKIYYSTRARSQQGVRARKRRAVHLAPRALLPKKIAAHRSRRAQSPRMGMEGVKKAKIAFSFSCTRHGRSEKEAAAAA